MYLSGTILDFSSRLHQLGADSGAFYSFIQEGNDYIASVDMNLSGQWEKEARQNLYRISGVSGLITSVWG